jgi:hypothetical protein
VDLAAGDFAIQVEGKDVFLARPIYIVPGHIPMNDYYPRRQVCA